MNEPFSTWAAGHGAWEVAKEVVKRPLEWFVRALARRSPFKAVTLCLGHRGQTRNLYCAAFASGKDVLYVSVMSESTLKEAEELLEKHASARTRLRVLTWHPRVDELAIESFRKHLSENAHDPTRTVEQVRRAADDWVRVAKRFSNVNVRGFRSSPTMQAILVADEWCIVELLPFATHPQERPALVLRSTQERESFQLFKSKFEALWDSAEAL